MKHNTLGDDVPIGIVFKAMGVESDQEIVQLVGSEPGLPSRYAPSLEDPVKENIYTQKQALKHIGEKIRSAQRPGTGYHNKSPEDEAREVLANVVLSHVPMEGFNFRPKAIYMGHIIGRVLKAEYDRALLDDKDYCGNKRLELAGQLLALLFEDKFKQLNAELNAKRTRVCEAKPRLPSMSLNTCAQFCITQGFIHAISTGNWVLKRFKMDRAGITQVLSRLSYVSALGMMTRITSQFEKTQKLAACLAAIAMGHALPSKCRGRNVRTCENLALLAHVTTDEDPAPILRLCFDLELNVQLHRREIHCKDVHLAFSMDSSLGCTHNQLNLFPGYEICVGAVL